MVMIDTAPTIAPSPLAHTDRRFTFVVEASLEKVAPLFGADGERRWAGPHWEPRFLYPQPAQDVEGAVFALEGGGHASLWVNTRFDLRAGLMQYVALVPNKLATIVDVRLSPRGKAATDVEVRYRRTALAADANADVEQLGQSDAAKGPEWQSAIATALAQ